MYANILIGFDNSPPGRKAVETACRFAKEGGSAITLLYVIPHYEEMLGFLKTESVKESLQQEARKIMEAGKALAAEHGVEVTTLVKEGHGADHIVEVAKEMGSDLIVIGTHGHRGLEKSILGSTAERVIMGADCPVLITR